MNMDYRQRTCVYSAMAGLIMVVIGYLRGDMTPAAIFLAILGLVLGLLLWFTRPSRSATHISHAAAQAAAADGDVILYWRPG